jgi:glycosyltransferase involved in cell wall biosynthesis
MTGRPSATVVHIFSGDLWAGAEVAIFNLLKQLREAPELSLVALALNEGTLAERLRGLGIETYVVPEAALSFPALLLATCRRLAKRRIDIIHSHRYKENLLAFLVAKSIGARSLVSTLHGLSEPAAGETRPAGRTRLKSRLDYCILRHGFDRVVAVSAEMKRVLVRRYGYRESRVAVIHNGIPLAEPAAPTASSPVLHIGSVGRLEPVKRFDLFLEVAALVRAGNRRVRFSILGDGPLRGELAAKARVLNVDDCVDFLPAVPDPRGFYRSLDIYLNTSLHEGLPLSILEAMAFTAPVVAPNVGGIPEIVSEGIEGMLVDGSEPRPFARACMALLADSGLRAAMGERARTRVQNEFRDTQMAAAYRTLYLELGQHGRDSEIPIPASRGHLRLNESCPRADSSEFPDVPA